MKHDTLDTNLQIRFGVANKEALDKCPKCVGKPAKDCLCYCQFAEISDQMRENCSQARKMYGEYYKKEEELEVEIDDVVNIGDVASMKKRVDKFKHVVAGKSILYKKKPRNNNDPKE